MAGIDDGDASIEPGEEVRNLDSDDDDVEDDGILQTDSERSGTPSQSVFNDITTARPSLHDIVPLSISFGFINILSSHA
jgi:hypothetical protein